MNKENKETKKEKKMEKVKVANMAVIRIRGNNKIRADIKDTLSMLKLYKKNSCVILQATPSIMGMIFKIKDYVTWGEIDDDTLKALEEKKGKENKFFALNPPRGGFEKKGIKVAFAAGGTTGYRKDKINELIKKMI